MPQVQRLADELTDAFNACDMRRYGAAFDDKVQVHEGGAALANSKAEWLAIQGRRCRSQVAFLRSVNESFRSLLIVDSVSEPRTAKPNAVVECCTYARAAIYKVNTDDYRIVDLNILVNEPGYWRSERR